MFDTQSQCNLTLYLQLNTSFVEKVFITRAYNT